MESMAFPVSNIGKMIRETRAPTHLELSPTFARRRAPSGLSHPPVQETNSPGYLLLKQLLGFASEALTRNSQPCRALIK